MVKLFYIQSITIPQRNKILYNRLEHDLPNQNSYYA